MCNANKLSRWNEFFMKACTVLCDFLTQIWSTLVCITTMKEDEQKPYTHKWNPNKRTQNSSDIFFVIACALYGISIFCLCNFIKRAIVFVLLVFSWPIKIGRKKIEDIWEYAALLHSFCQMENQVQFDFFDFYASFTRVFSISISKLRNLRRSKSKRRLMATGNSCEKFSLWFEFLLFFGIEHTFQIWAFNPNVKIVENAQAFPRNAVICTIVYTLLAFFMHSTYVVGASEQDFSWISIKFHSLFICTSEFELRRIVILQKCLICMWKLTAWTNIIFSEYRSHFLHKYFYRRFSFI